MSKFYGTVIGSAKTNATRRGHSGIRVAAQSYSGSVITELYYHRDELMVHIETADGSSTEGEVLFDGTFEDFHYQLCK